MESSRLALRRIHFRARVGVSSDTKTMQGSAKASFDRTRRWTAWISLLAILMMYAPIAGATFMALTGECCTGDQCPIHGNHHPVKNNSTAKNENTPMDCGHQNHAANKMQSCAMSCCHNVEQSAVHARIFVLTPVSIATALAPRTAATSFTALTNISPSFAPLAPPPKSLAS